MLSPSGVVLHQYTLVPIAWKLPSFQRLPAGSAEKPDLFGRLLILVGLAEGIAIYGLIIAFIIIGG